MQEYEQLQKFLERGNYTREEKIAIIKEFGKLYEQKINKEYLDYRNKQIAAGILEIGSAAIPGAGIGGSAVKAGAGQFLQKSLGRKLAQKVTESTVDGAISGAAFGFGRGLAEDKNPLYTAATDAVFGGLYGGTVGGAIAKPANDAHINETKTINELRKYWGIPFRKASGNTEKAIDTLLENKQGFVPNAFFKKGIGNVDMVWGNSKYGLQHIIERRNSQNINGVDFVKNLPELAKEGTFYNKAGHNDRQYIGNGINEITIKNNLLNTKEKTTFDRNWLLSSYKLDNPQATHVRLTSESNYPDKQTSFIGLEDINNINDSIKKYNLDKWLFENPSIPLNSHNNTPKNGVLETGISYNEFNPNVIQNQQNQADYSNYRNPLSGDNKIYTREDIGNMPNEEFTEKEEEIRSQWGKIGIPSNAQMNSASGAVYIAPYTRSDGTQVKGHYRSR